MLNDNAKKWVAALRSGEFKQGIGALHLDEPDNSYCCLGVACELYRHEHPEITWELNENENILGFGDYENYETLPSMVMDWLGLRTDMGQYGICAAGTSLAADNDNEMSFDQIADIIESEPLNLFLSAPR